MGPAYPQAQHRNPRQNGSSHIHLDDINFGKRLDPNLFAGIAKTKAKAIAREGQGGKNKSTQIRKFYDELAMWHDRVFLARDDAGKASDDARQQEYDKLAPFIKMLCAKVAYAKGREHVSDGFEKLFTHIVDAIDAPETLKHAKFFMEAFMGFYKAEGK